MSPPAPVSFLARSVQRSIAPRPISPCPGMVKPTTPPPLDTVSEKTLNSALATISEKSTNSQPNLRSGLSDPYVLIA